MENLPDFLERLPRLSPLDEPTFRSRVRRLSNVRFTMKPMMIAVAIVAMALGLGVTVHRRKERCLRLADFHQAQAEAWAFVAYEGVP